MELESTDNIEMVYETLKNINTAITRLQERSIDIHSVDDYLMSPTGMEKLDAACMVLIALGESVKTLDKLTEKKLLSTYPSVDWKGVMGISQQRLFGSSFSGIPTTTRIVLTCM